MQLVAVLEIGHSGLVLSDRIHATLQHVTLASTQIDLFLVSIDSDIPKASHQSSQMSETLQDAFLLLLLIEYLFQVLHFWKLGMQFQYY